MNLVSVNYKILDIVRGCDWPLMVISHSNSNFITFAFIPFLFIHSMNSKQKIKLKFLTIFFLWIEIIKIRNRNQQVNKYTKTVELIITRVMICNLWNARHEAFIHLCVPVKKFQPMHANELNVIWLGCGHK